MPTVSKREAARLVYVSGLRDDYRLQVKAHAATRAYRDLAYSAFTNFRAAQTIANAIRAAIARAPTKRQRDNARNFRAPVLVNVERTPDDGYRVPTMPREG